MGKEEKKEILKCTIIETKLSRELFLVSLGKSSVGGEGLMVHP